MPDDKERTVAQTGYAVGVDIGGTFTDFVLIDLATGALFTEKALTTPHDPSEAVGTGVARLLRSAGLNAAAVDRVIHGTTLVINAVIEKKGARTCFVATEGFTDLLEVGREIRYDIYDLDIEMPRPLVSRRDTIGIAERITANGDVVVELSEEELPRLVDELRARDAEAAAICFLHAYRNPEHEQRIARYLAEALPEVAVSTSHRVLGQWREYERACATVINAYAQPITSRYIRRLEGRLRDLGIGCDWYVMATNGGIVTPEIASEFPIRILESGPAGGALAAAFMGELSNNTDLVAFDMGGTTAKVTLVQQREPLITSDYEVARVERLKAGSGYPVKLPVIDMIEIGAGGGSIGRIDELGLISVGPESAGAAPGPACYGRGGTAATVTDANLVLGYLAAEDFVSDNLSLDLGAAEAALAAFGEPAGLSPQEAAWAIHSIVTQNMAEAVRIHAVERSVDYRRLSMIAFGGAGPVHAYRMAKTLDVSTVIFPRAAGVFSALGFLVAPLSFDFVTTRIGGIENLATDDIASVYAEFEEQIADIFGRSGVSDDQIERVYRADMRYQGQGYELEVPLPTDFLESALEPGLRAAFEAAYEGRYGRILPGAPIEVVSWRCTARTPRPEIGISAPTVSPGDEGRIRTRMVYVDPELGEVECPVYARGALAVGDIIEGPALVVEAECTSFIGPGATATVDPAQNLVMEIRTELRPLTTGGAGREAAR